jgi:hypothetical protein
VLASSHCAEAVTGTTDADALCQRERDDKERRSAVRRAQDIRAKARVLYGVAKRSDFVDDGLLHVLHALELEDEAAALEDGERNGRGSAG